MANAVQWFSVGIKSESKSVWCEISLKLKNKTFSDNFTRCWCSTKESFPNKFYLDFSFPSNISKFGRTWILIRRLFMKGKKTIIIHIMRETLVDDSILLFSILLFEPANTSKTLKMDQLLHGYRHHPKVAVISCH